MDQPELIVQILEEIYQVDQKQQARMAADTQFRVLSQIRRVDAEESHGGIVRRKS